MTRRLDVPPEARADLRRLPTHITERPGTARAAAYMVRIEARCVGLVEFPTRGVERGDPRPSLLPD
jgi:plasmid stabilization system protein ParE